MSSVPYQSIFLRSGKSSEKGCIMKTFEFSVMCTAIIIASTIIPTLILEFPFVYFGIAKKVGFFVVLNVITNMTFNMILFLISFLTLTGWRIELPIYIWYVAGELVLIPLGEALAYKQVADKSFKRIVLFSYLANVTSFIAGLSPLIIWHLIK